MVTAVGLFCIALSSCLVAHPAGARPLDDVVASGTLRVAVYSDNKPFSTAGNGTPAGIDVALAEAIARKLNVGLDLRIGEAGEDADGDFRLNLWKGDLAGTPLADLMLHVPNDRQLALRNEQIFLTAPYFEQHIAFAYRKGELDGLQSLGDTEGHPIAVEAGGSADMLILLAEGGRYRENVQHFRDFAAAAAAFVAKQTPVLAGTKAEIQAALHDANISPDDAPVIEIKVVGMVKNSWELAGATRSDSRDLAYAAGNAISALVKSGELKAICEKYGVAFTPPKLD
jgi:ABC-type amino acid transport substrate-binding protein